MAQTGNRERQEGAEGPFWPAGGVARALLALTAVTNSKQLLRDGLVGFLLGVLVMSTVAIVTWQSRSHAAEVR